MKKHIKIFWIVYLLICMWAMNLGWQNGKQAPQSGPFLPMSIGGTITPTPFMPNAAWTETPIVTIPTTPATATTTGGIYAEIVEDADIALPGEIGYQTDQPIPVQQENPVMDVVELIANTETQSPTPDAIQTDSNYNGSITGLDFSSTSTSTITITPEPDNHLWEEYALSKTLDELWDLAIATNMDERYGIGPCTYPLPTPYVTWETTKEMSGQQTKDRLHTEVKMLSSDIANAAAKGGGYFPRNGVVQIEEEVVKGILIELLRKGKINGCTDPDGKPAAYNVQNFLNIMSTYIKQ